MFRRYHQGAFREAPEIHIIAKPEDPERLFVIASTSQAQLVKQKRRRAAIFAVVALMFVLLLALTLVVRCPTALGGSDLSDFFVWLAECELPSR